MIKKTLSLRLDARSKRYLEQAAALRRIGVSEYVRMVTVEHAKREVLAARQQALSLTPQEQLAFGNALNEPVKLTAAQKKLSAVMQSES